MNISEYKISLHAAHPPKQLSVCLESLWYDRKGNWKKAHDLIDELPGKDAARIHAYLHRVEGDLWNAGYWYKRAGKNFPDCTLEQEWEELVALFLQ